MMSGDGTTVVVAQLPSCDIHRLTKNEVVAAAYDGKTRNGPWAFMCTDCFIVHGVGLGLGAGQRLILLPQQNER